MGCNAHGVNSLRSLCINCWHPSVAAILPNTSIIYIGKRHGAVHYGCMSICIKGYFGMSVPGSKGRRGFILISQKYLARPPLNYKSGITQWYLFYVFCFWHKYSSKSATLPFIRRRRANRYRRCSSRLVRFSIRWSS